MKSDQDVIKEFNEVVNMTADELEAFLKTGDSESTGWSKDDGSGESVGHESGRKIVKILQSNPSKDPSKYSEEDLQHMRKVVAYCARHLAQESHLKEEKSPEELEKAKSTRSLKNWGHDPLKTMKGGSGSKKTEKPASKKAEKPASKKAADKPVSKKAEDKKEDKAEKPASKKAADKPASKKAADKPVSKKGKAAEDKDEAAAETGDKRAADEKPAASEKPASKKAKTAKPPSEGTRKPPSRGVKKA